MTYNLYGYTNQTNQVSWLINLYGEEVRRTVLYQRRVEYDLSINDMDPGTINQYKGGIPRAGAWCLWTGLGDMIWRSPLVWSAIDISERFTWLTPTAAINTIVS